MKSMVPLILLLISASLVTGCGKKEETGPSQTNQKSPMTTSERLSLAEKEFRRSVKNNDTQSLRAVIFDNPDLSLDEHFEDGETALTFAIKKKFHLIRNILLEKGANPDLRTLNVDYTGFTSLMLASLLGDAAAINSLVKHNASLNIQDEAGECALHKAVRSKSLDAVKALVQAGAILKIKNRRGLTPLDLTRPFPSVDVSEYLQGMVHLDEGVPTMATFGQILVEADLVNYRKLIQTSPGILEEFASLNPLNLVMESKNEMNGLEMTQSLLHHNVSPDGPENAETPPLVLAVLLNKKDFVELLLRYKADPKRLDKQNHPALYYAIEGNDEAMVDLLMSNGAEERFEIVKNGEKINFKGCRTADLVQKRLTLAEDLFINRRIQSRLGCRWTR